MPHAAAIEFALYVSLPSGHKGMGLRVRHGFHTKIVALPDFSSSHNSEPGLSTTLHHDHGREGDMRDVMLRDGRR